MNRCDYCEAEGDEEGEDSPEFSTYSAGDECLTVCDSCREGMID